LLYSFILSVVFLAVCSKSSFLYPFNDWYDANDFLTMGKGIAHGLVPYRDLYEQKGPILYFLHTICYLIPGPHFFGVYVLEAAAFTLFLYHAGKIILLYLRPHAPYWILPILSGLILSSESFCQGDSAEELCAALLMVTFYETLAYFSGRYPLPLSYRKLFFHGLLAGIILWIKYTLLGFHLAFMAVLFFILVSEKSFARSIKSCLAFLAGMALPALPVAAYFTANDALADLFQVYFYNNMFLYDSGKSSGIVTLLVTILMRIGDTFFRNIQFSMFTIIGVLAFIISGKFLRNIAGKIMLIAEAALLAFFIYTGSNFPYYGYILCIFPVLGFVSIGALVEFIIDRFHRIPSPRELMEALFRKLPPEFSQMAGTYGHAYGGSSSEKTWDTPAETDRSYRFKSLILCAVCLVFAFYKSPNTYMLGASRADQVQYQFAEIMHETEDPTLLNYGFLDAGFYTAADILPTERFFQMQNISYEAFPEMMDSQDACIREQRVDYVITRGEEVPEWIFEYYTVAAQQRQLYEGSNVQYTLLQKK